MESIGLPTTFVIALLIFTSLDCGGPRPVEMTHSQTAEWRMVGNAIPHKEGRALWRWTYGPIRVPIKDVQGPKVTKAEFETIQRKIRERLAGFEAHLEGKPLSPEASSNFRAGWHSAAIHGESP